MGASQFRLLCTLGLRAHHRLLDVGCGSLRAGRLFITYLDPDRYCGIEPNAWLIDEAIEHQLGRDAVAIKRPRFDHNTEFRAEVFGHEFDYILAQSIFSHTGHEMAERGLTALARVLAPDGVLLVTFKEGQKDTQENGWIYPGCVKYRPDTVVGLATHSGLLACRLPWAHPSQVWYLMTKTAERIPPPEMLQHLTGRVFFDEQFSSRS